MATVEQIIREIQEEIDAKEYSPARIISLMNDGLASIAAGVFPDIPDLPEICLPDLEAEDDVTTDITLSYVALPTDFQKKLVACYSAEQNRDVAILDSLDLLKRKEPGLSGTYSVRYVAVAGGSLYYQGIPSSADTLTLTYFKKPTTLAPGSTPSELPDHLQKRLLKNYCLREMYRKKEYGLPQKGNVGFYHSELVRALGELALFTGTYAKRPQRISNDMDYLFRTIV